MLCQNYPMRKEPEAGGSFPMRDEPERRNRFQCGMSLYETAEEGAMLRVNEYHHVEHSAA